MCAALITFGYQPYLSSPQVATSEEQFFLLVPHRHHYNCVLRSEHRAPRCVLFRPFVAIGQIEAWRASGLQTESDTFGQRDRRGALR